MPAVPVGAARNVEDAWLFREASVKVPAVVTGLPLTVNSPVESASPTDVTVPTPAGRSAVTRALNVGIAAAPVAGPANTVLAV